MAVPPLLKKKLAFRLPLKQRNLRRRGQLPSPSRRDSQSLGSFSAPLTERTRSELVDYPRCTCRQWDGAERLKANRRNLRSNSIGRI